MRFAKQCVAGAAQWIRHILPAVVVIAGMALFARAAPMAVPTGGGSYASYPPKGSSPNLGRMLSWHFPLVHPRNHPPIPTNKYWTDLLNGQPRGSLWSYPWRVDPKHTGLQLFFPQHSNADGTNMDCNRPLVITGLNFRANGVLIKNWGDWTFTFRLPQSASRYMDVTLGEGMPLVWVQPHGVTLSITPTGKGQYLTPTGTPIAFPYRGRELIVRADQRLYAVFVPPGTHFTNSGNTVNIHISYPRAFAAFAPLQTLRQARYFATCAASIPINSTVDWAYRAKTGAVNTRWSVQTRAMVPGSPNEVVQGWLPHQWMQSQYAMKLNGPAYVTARGEMKTSRGNNFKLSWHFSGFLPVLPAPGSFAKSDHFSPAIMAKLLKHCSDNSNYGDDTYWGGKDLLRFTQYMLMAHELHNKPEYKTLRAEAYRALSDWLTYTPGEKAHYFARYKNWPALVGFHTSYGSGSFNDQHFHYGYFTYSAAMLGMQDPAFLKKYGPMITLVAKEYANWNRKSRRFPVLRTFDIWAGHSWAGGLSSPGGENQESSSEAMQSWIGLYLLGTMLHNPRMRATGAMGYAMESRAALDYWFNEPGNVLPPQYKHPMYGMVWSGGGVFGTYFSGDPCWVYGINCLPQSPGLDYLVRYSGFARTLFHKILGDRNIATMGDLGNVLLAQASQADPAWACREFDHLWQAKNAIVRNNMEAGVTYYDAHAYNQLGPRQWNIHLTVPTSSVYHNGRTGVTTYAVYNPHHYPVLVRATEGMRVLGGFVALPGRITCAHSLSPIKRDNPIQASLPRAGAKHVSREVHTVYVVFRAALNPADLRAVALSGPDAPELVPTLLDDGRVLACALAHSLQPSRRYTLVIPTSLRFTSGGRVLAKAGRIEFTLAAEPPLRLTASTPANGAARVAVSGLTMQLKFNAPLNPRSISAIRLVGAGSHGLKVKMAHHGWWVDIKSRSSLLYDHTYRLVVPAGLTSRFGHALGHAVSIQFSTTPEPCPPNVYTESFAGNGVGTDGTVKVNLRCTKHPYAGHYCICVSGGAKGGSAYFFNGTSDHGSGWKPVNLTGYSKLRFYIRGNTGSIWFKIGHPVFDGAFFQTQLHGITDQYKRFALPIPKPKTHIGTLFVVSVPAGKTIYLDNVRFIK